MNNIIDAKGKACPIPVIMAKKESDKGQAGFTINVDNKTAVENLNRFGNSKGYDVIITEKAEDNIFVRFAKKGEKIVPPYEAKGLETYNDNWERKKNWAVFIGKEGIGQGEPELGSTLMKMYFYTLEQGESRDVPSYVLFMNHGVKVPVYNQQAIEHLENLEKMGTRILVCGACLNFYNLAEKLRVGTVSNMYDIVEAMQEMDKIVTL